MVYGLLVTLFIILGIFIILFVLVQPSKSSLGVGAMSGESQMLFGGSGGQNFFQKATWTMGTLFMALSLLLALMRSSISETRFIKKLGGTTQVVQEAPQENAAQDQPAETDQETAEGK